MTRYVGENTGAKAVAQSRWGVEDVRKRPAPMPDGVAVAYLNALETAVGVSRDVGWDLFITNAPSVFATAATSGGAISNTAGDTWVRIAKPGYLWLAASARWASPTVGQQIDITSVGPSPLADYTETGETYVTTVNTRATYVEGPFVLGAGSEPGYVQINLLSGASSNAEVDFSLWLFAGAELEVVF